MQLTRILTAATVVATATVAAVTAAPAQDAPTTMEIETKVSPNKAGTKRNPQGVKITTVARFETPPGLEKPIMQKVDVLFPKGGLYNGGKYPSCTQNTLARRGPRGCPRGAIMGTGTASAYADTVITYPKITVVNGGARKVFFYTVMNNPARVQAPVPGTITKLSGKWSYRLHVEVPRVLQIVAGIPIAIRDFRVTAGKGEWLATTSCPKSRKWVYSVEAFLSTGGSTKYDGSTPCR